MTQPVVKENGPVILTPFDPTKDHTDEAYGLVVDKKPIERGGPGSGHFGHEGRPGEVGGSRPSGNRQRDIQKSINQKFENMIDNLGSQIEIWETPKSGNMWISPTGKYYNAGMSHQNILNLSFQRIQFTGDELEELNRWSRDRYGYDFVDGYSYYYLIRELKWVRVGAEAVGLPGYLRSKLNVDFNLPISRAAARTLRELTLYYEEQYKNEPRFHIVADVFGQRDGEGTDELFANIGVTRGGPGSGHFGHEGRPGEVGGSQPSGGSRLVRGYGGYHGTLTKGYGGFEEGFQIKIGNSTVSGSLYNADMPGKAMSRTRGEIFYIEVPESDRRQGRATSLVDMALRTMLDEGVKTVVMDAVTPEGRSLIEFLIDQRFIEGELGDSKSEFDIALEPIELPDGVDGIASTVFDSYAGQVNGSTYAYGGSASSPNIIGSIDWSLFDGTLFINMIEVDENYRRQGIATALLRDLKNEYPDVNIKISGDFATEEGQAWLSSVSDIIERGGPGSGHFGHEGRPGEVGGSQPSGAADEIKHRPINLDWGDMTGLISAWIEGKQVGSLAFGIPTRTSLQEQGYELELGWTIVQEPYRGRGIATQMMDRFWQEYGDRRIAPFETTPEGMKFMKRYFGDRGIEYDTAGNMMWRVQDTNPVRRSIGAWLDRTWKEFRKLFLGEAIERGGPGSGHFGHEGRPGEVGGSLPSTFERPRGLFQPGEVGGDMPMSDDRGENIRRALEWIYGITDNPHDAGFILPDGRMIQMWRRASYATIHRRAIAAALEQIGEHLPPEAYTDLGPSEMRKIGGRILSEDTLRQFMAESKIVRFSLDEEFTLSIDIAHQPTRRQWEIMEDLFYQTINKRGRYWLEIAHPYNEYKKWDVRAIQSWEPRTVDDFEEFREQAAVHVERSDEKPLIFRGGPGSGHHGHRGRPGEVGGSAPSSNTFDLRTDDLQNRAARYLIDEYGKADLDNADLAAWISPDGELLGKSADHQESAMGVMDELGIDYGADENTAIRIMKEMGFIRFKFVGYDIGVDVVAPISQAQKRTLLDIDAVYQGNHYWTFDILDPSRGPYWYQEDKRGGFDWLGIVERGGPGSGHFGHEGRPGEVGGSLPSGATDYQSQGGGEQAKSPRVRLRYDPQSSHDALSKSTEDGVDIMLGPNFFQVEDQGGRANILAHEVGHEVADRYIYSDGVDFWKISDSLVAPQNEQWGGEVPNFIFGRTRADEALSEAYAVYTELGEEPFTDRGGPYLEALNILKKALEFSPEFDFTWSDYMQWADDLPKDDPQIEGISTLTERGGPGSGHHGHRGRPGEIGGSLPKELGDLELEMGIQRIPAPENGKPVTLHLYRGVTPRGSVDAGMYGKGTYFTPHRHYAEGYAQGGNLIEANVTLNKPFVAEYNEVENLGRPEKQAVFNRGGTIAEANEASATAIRQKLEADGYDGIVIITNPYSDIRPNMVNEVVVFERSGWDTISITARGGPGSGHFGHEGRPGEVGGSKPSGIVGSRDIFIGVPADIAEPGTSTMDMHDFKQQSGAPIRGHEVIAFDDPRIPDRVYHMTTNLPGILQSGEISARGVGGLGGDKYDQIVSMTISEDVARLLAHDMRTYVTIVQEFLPTEPQWVPWDEREAIGGAVHVDRNTGEPLTVEQYREWATGLLNRLNELDQSVTGDWEFEWDFDYHDPSYSTSDWIRQYYMARSHRANIKNPLFMGEASNYLNHDPRNIGVVSIPRENLNTGALLVDFDLRNQYGLQEIRLYGDLPLDNAEVIDGELVERGGPGSGHHGHKGRPGKVGGSLPDDAGDADTRMLWGQSRSASQSGTLKYVYEKIKNMEYEYAYFIEPDGDSVLSKTSHLKDTVTFYPEEWKKAEGNVMIHNHPSGSSLSPEDVMFGAEVGATEVIAVGSNDAIYSMVLNAERLRPTKRIEKLGPNVNVDVEVTDDSEYRKFVSAIMQANERIYAELRPLVVSGQISVAQAEHTHNHRLWQLFSSEHPEWVEYYFEFPRGEL